MSGDSQLPPPIDDPILGHLVWDEHDADGVLIGEVKHPPGRSVTVMIVFDLNEYQVEEVVARARVALERFRQREREYRLWTAAELNESRWNDEDEWAEEDLANMLMIATFDFNGEGQLTIYWDDSDLLFSGHNVLTVIDPDGNPIEAGMQ